MGLRYFKVIGQWFHGCDRIEPAPSGYTTGYAVKTLPIGFQHLSIIMFITTYSASSITCEALHRATKSQYQELNESWSVTFNINSGSIVATTNAYKVAVGY